MNLDRSELKFRAKNVLATKYWPFFFVSLLEYIALGFVGFNFNSNSINSIRNAALLILLIGSASILGLLINIFFVNPFRVGLCKFMVFNSENQYTDYSPLWNIFKENYLQVVKTTFIRDVFLVLWSLPYILGMGICSAFAAVMSSHPGFVLSIFALGLFLLGLILSIGGLVLMLYKTYSYYMTDYIIAENPYISSREAISASKDMMYGVKVFAFLLQLSFIGWFLLGLLLCGIGTLFVLPYQNATMAQFYMQLRDQQDIYNKGYRIIN